MNASKIRRAFARTLYRQLVPFLLVFLYACLAYSQDAVQLDDPSSSYDLAASGWVHPDSDERFGAENVSELLETVAGGELPVATDRDTQRFWFVFSVQNNTLQRDWVVSFHAPMIHRVTLFTPDDTGVMAPFETGYETPVERRMHPALDYALPLSIAPNESRVVAVLVEDPVGELPESGDIQIESDHRFRTQTFRMIAAALLSLGAVLAVGIYMLLIWARLRERTYLWFGAFSLTSFVLWATHYELFRLVLGGSWDLRLLNFMSNAASLLFCVLFARAFLNVDRWSEGWDRAGLGLVCALVGLLGVTPFLSTNAAYISNAGAALLTLVFVLCIGAHAVAKEIERAGTFLAAWAVYFSTGFLTIIDALGVGLPTVSIRLLTVTAVALGTLLMAWSVGNQLQELISQKRLAELRARTDALTQLANRASFEDEIDQLQHQYDAGLITDLLVLFADLDGLKVINDTHGHEVGDRLLKDFSRLLEDRFRNVDGIYRVGGDEFVLLLPDAKPSFAKWMPERIDQVIEKLRVMGYEAASVSIGIAMTSEAGGDARHAVRLADERMYREKDSSSSG